MKQETVIVVPHLPSMKATFPLTKRDLKCKQKALENGIINAPSTFLSHDLPSFMTLYTSLKSVWNLQFEKHV